MNMKEKGEKAKPVLPRLGESDAIDDRGMVQLIRQDHILRQSKPFELFNIELIFTVSL